MVWVIWWRLDLGSCTAKSSSCHCSQKSLSLSFCHKWRDDILSHTAATNGEDDSSNPHGGSTTASSSPSTNHSRVECSGGSTNEDADSDLEPDPKLGSYQDNPELESDDDLEPESDDYSDDDYLRSFRCTNWHKVEWHQLCPMSLIGNFIRFPMAKAEWDAITTTYYDGTDTSQEDRVYIFLDGLNDRLDKGRSDILHVTSFSTVDQAYAYVRREDVRQAVMMGSSAPNGAGLAAKSEPRSGPLTRAGLPQNSSTAAHF
ncbi:hypothetical protein L3X38_019729 [Prunus dulcis]|uniref:Uncharacterized protein n=1 Tax=Prunus dulcis TaxID=3755 RepID=A0AAD4WBH2_PRUDU|nr:hypothetical protein L3X38_019729 [Prunus dulcis]